MSAGQLLRGVGHSIYHSDAVDEWVWNAKLSEDQRRAAAPKVFPPRLSRSIATTLLNETPLKAYREHARLGGVGKSLEFKGADMGTIVHALVTGEGPPVEVCMIPPKDSKGKLREASPAWELEAALTASIRTASNRGFIPAADWKTKDAQAFQDAARARGAIPVLLHDLVQAKGAAVALPEKLAALGIDLAAFESELTILWESGGVAMKTRPDLTSLSLGQFLDFKIKAEISESAFEASVVKYGLDMQAAAACEGLAAVYPELAGRLSFAFVVCEWRPPYDVMIKPIEQLGLEYGRGRWERAKAMWKRLLPLPMEEWPGWGIRRPWEPKPWNLEAELTAAFQAAEEPDFAKGAGL